MPGAAVSLGESRGGRSAFPRLRDKAMEDEATPGEHEAQPSRQTPAGSSGETSRDEKVRALKRAISFQSGGLTLRPEDIAVVRIEFTMPASRLFGSLTAGSGKELDADVGPGADPPPILSSGHQLDADVGFGGDPPYVP